MHFKLFMCFVGVLGRTRSFILNGNEGPEPGFRPPLTVSQLEEMGWKMVFRGTSGNGQDTLKAWTTGVATSDTKPYDMKRSYTSHYRDPLLTTHWTALGVKLVKFALYKQSEEVGYIVFNGTGSDLTSWFDRTRVEDSSWSDLTATNAYNFFSIQGHDNGLHLERTFFINQQYGGCDADKGNVVVVEHDGDCNWDHQPRYPQFLYSDMNSADFWNRRQFGRADYLAIFIYTGSQ